MTDNEFKRLNRAQLIDVIYQLQLQIDELTEQKKELERALADKRLYISNIGNLAEAALEINKCFLSAQSAAEQYLNEIMAIREETEEQRREILAYAYAEARMIAATAGKPRAQFDTDIEQILQEFRQDPSDNG